MTAVDVDPFAINRWEFETEHTVWVPTFAKDALGQFPCHIQGVRGSGKTALLRIADYYTRRSRRMKIANPSSVTPFCLGVYVNFLDEFTSFINTEEDSDLYYDYTYIYCLAKVFELIDDASRDGLLHYNANTERAISRNLSDEFGILDREQSAETFTACASYLRRYCRLLRENAISSTTPATGTSRRISGYALFNSTCRLLTQNEVLHHAGNDYFIKICVDDAHLLEPAAQRKLNAILARSQFPIFWNIAFVEGQFDPYDVDNKAKYVTAHDRRVIDLNYRDNYSVFQEVCENIFELRVSTMGEDVIKPKLGDKIRRTTIPILFEAMLSRSNKYSVSETIRPFFDRLRQVLKNDDRTLSYKAFVCANLFNSLDEFDHFLAARSEREVDNYLRQKQTAALVVGAKVMKLPVFYCGLNAMFYLADGCLRDFLALCSALVKRQNSKSVGSFWSKDMLDLDLQTGAFFDYASAFAGGLHNPRQPYARQLSGMVQGLGHLTYLLQTDDLRQAFLLPDRGVFRVEFDPGQKSFLDEDITLKAQTRALIREGVYTGSLRLEGEKSIQSPYVDIRLSGLLAPVFQTAPRRPYRRVTITYLDLSALCNSLSIEDSKKTAELIYARALSTTANAVEFSDERLI